MWRGWGGGGRLRLENSDQVPARCSSIKVWARACGVGAGAVDVMRRCSGRNTCHRVRALGEHQFHLAVLRKPGVWMREGSEGEQRDIAGHNDTTLGVSRHNLSLVYFTPAFTPH